MTRLVASALGSVLLLVGCVRGPRPELRLLAARVPAALASGDTRVLAEVAQKVYQAHGLELEGDLEIRTQGQDTLSSFYDEDANQIVLAEAAPPGPFPEQLRALAMALTYSEDPWLLPA